MNDMTKKDTGQESDPHAGHKRSNIHATHDQHAGHSVVMFRDKFWLTLILTLPVVVWSREVQHWLGYTALAFPGSKFIPPILGTVVFLYGGLVFTRGAWGELTDHKPGMMTLISLGIMVAFAASLAATFGFFAIDVWWEVAALITIMLLGHWLEMKAVAQARGALDALAALLPDDFLSTVAGLGIKNEISARRAAVLAYITNQLLRTLPIIQQENPPQIIFDLPHPKPTLEERRADPNSSKAASLKYYESLAP